MKLFPFKMERWQSTWEKKVEYNLSESGVEPMTLNELLDGEIGPISTARLGYVQTNGSQELRETIASLYDKAGADNVLVTNGSSEANFVSAWPLLERGAEVAVMLPNYMQVWGLAKTMGCRVRPFWLKERKGRWSLDTQGLGKAVSKRTKLVAVCNPNNPTGSVLDEETMDEIVRVAAKAGAWILSDEVYSGAELDGRETPSFWGRYDKVLVTSGLSKAYGLPGLRMGWVASAPRMVEKLWAYHDYTTIAPTALSDHLAKHALRADVRKRILDRTRQIVRNNLEVVREWLGNLKGLASMIEPQAGAITLVKYALNVGSDKLALRLLKEKSTLVVPGSQFNMGKYLRIGFGEKREHLEGGLRRVGEMLENLSKGS